MHGNLQLRLPTGKPANISRLLSCFSVLLKSYTRSKHGKMMEPCNETLLHILSYAIKAFSCRTSPSQNKAINIDSTRGCYPAETHTVRWCRSVMDLLVEEPLYGPGLLPNGVKTFERGQDVQMTAGHPLFIMTEACKMQFAIRPFRAGWAIGLGKFFFHLAFQTFDLSKL